MTVMSCGDPSEAILNLTPAQPLTCSASALAGIGCLRLETGRVRCSNGPVPAGAAQGEGGGGLTKTGATPAAGATVVA
ncbi:MAG: hypothetical protein JO264_10575 [Acidisphaera sp.]|nr:hypothetical protein [Acidisphaera sp.]